MACPFLFKVWRGAASQSARRFQITRNHMNHGGGSHHHHQNPRAKPGPRSTVPLGLEAAESSSNILRLLEASHGGLYSSDALSTVWHPKGVLWTFDQKQWVAINPSQIDKAVKASQAPSLISLALSDSRTALVKLVGVDGLVRFISLLRLEAEFLPSMQQLAGSSGVPNDGWLIIQEIVSSQPRNSLHTSTMDSLNSSLLDYLSIEHGGGPEDHKRADNLFHSDSSLFSIGTLHSDEQASEWAGPVGSVVHISRSAYLEGVASQSPHNESSKQNDGILTLDILPCGLVAAATVEVGNGAQTNVFCDHLFLARSSLSDKRWQIMAKVFSPRAWK